MIAVVCGSMQCLQGGGPWLAGFMLGRVDCLCALWTLKSLHAVSYIRSAYLQQCRSPAAAVAGWNHGSASRLLLTSNDRINQ